METLAKLSQRMRADWNRRLAFDADYWMSEPFRDQGEFLTSGVRDLGSLLKNLDSTQFSDWKVLEYGCGTGRLTSAAAPLFASLNAVDISQRAVIVARERLSGSSHVRFSECNGIDLQSEQSASYNLVFSYAVLSHVERPVFYALLGEIIRVLKPGGRLRMQLYVGEDQYERGPADTITVRGYRPEVLSLVLRQLGCLDVNFIELALPFDASFEGTLVPVVVEAIKGLRSDKTQSADVTGQLTVESRSSRESFIECAMLYERFNKEIKNLQTADALRTAFYLETCETRPEKLAELAQAVLMLKKLYPE